MKNHKHHKLNKKFVQSHKSHHFLRRYFGLFSACLGVVLLGTVFLFGVASAVNDTKLSVSLTVPSSCTASGEGHQYSKDINGGSSAEIGSGTVFNIYCNDEEGWVVYAVGNGKDVADGETKEGVTDLIGTNVENKITTGLLTGGNLSNWFFKLSGTTPGMIIEDSFKENSMIPNTRTKVVSRPSGTSSSSGDSFTATYLAYISPTQKPDTYTGGVKYIMFHPSTEGPTEFKPKNYSITYDPGLGWCDEAPSISKLGNMPSPNPQTGTIAAESVTLNPNTPNRGNEIIVNNFQYWCTVKPEEAFTCTGQTYLPGAEFPLSEGDNNITLYATWEGAFGYPGPCAAIPSIH